MVDYQCDKDCKAETDGLNPFFIRIGDLTEAQAKQLHEIIAPVVGQWIDAEEKVEMARQNRLATMAQEFDALNNPAKTTVATEVADDWKDDE